MTGSLPVMHAGRRAWRRLAVHRRVVVNLYDGTSFTGILWDAPGELLVLRRATLHSRGAEPVAVDGEVVLQRVHISFVQVPPTRGDHTPTRLSPPDDGGWG